MWTKENLFQFMEEKTTKMVAVCKAKNNDYTGKGKSPFANFEKIGQFGGSIEWGFLTRMSDKFSRICSFAENVELQVKDESVEDTLVDLANYCLLFAAYLKSKREEETAIGGLTFRGEPVTEANIDLVTIAIQEEAQKFGPSIKRYKDL